MASGSCTHAISPPQLGKFGKGIFTVGKNVIMVDRCFICFEMLDLGPFPPLKQKETLYCFHLKNGRELHISVL